MQKVPAHETALSDARPVGTRGDQDVPFHRDDLPASSTARQNLTAPHATPVRFPGRGSAVDGALQAPLNVAVSPAALSAAHPPDGAHDTATPLPPGKTLDGADHDEPLRAEAVVASPRAMHEVVDAQASDCTPAWST